MLIGAIALGLVLGLAVGGRLQNLADLRLRLLPTLVFAVVVRFGAELAINRDLPYAELLRLPAYVVAYGLLLYGLWSNRRQPGLAAAFIGVLGNAVAIAVNGGRMPIWEESARVAGLLDVAHASALHVVLPSQLDASFILHAGPLGDVIPIPLPLIANVASIGDIFLSGGLAFFLFAVVAREPELQPKPAHRRAEGELPAEVVGLEHPLMLGGDLVGAELPGASVSAATAGAAMAGTGGGAGGGTAAIGLELPFDRPAERVRRHPYVRLALNSTFSAMWLGHVISLFGDRIHQIALAFFVLQATNSPVAVAFVFVSATLPNLIVGPLAGTLVDRWDQRQVMIVSDLLRAAAVLLIPVAASINVFLAYPLVFIITTISLFFRPARTAVIPRIVKPDELMTANSATWIAETLADIIGYPLAGLFVAFLGTAMPLAFWFDAATFIASGMLIASVVIPPLDRVEEAAAEGLGAIWGEMMEGWHFLRGETVLLANTLQGVLGQFTIGVTIAVTPIYARDFLERGLFDATTTYAFLETAIGVGNLVGGLAIGFLGARLAKGRMVIVGYVAFGLCTLLLGLTGNMLVALGLMLGTGIANMVYVIPSQTLFQERAPADMIGRVVGFRFSLVFGAMSLAMAASGILASNVGVPPVLIAFGAASVLAGLGGLIIPSVRNA